MEVVQNPVTENILGLTLEIIALLTGEDYDVVKKSGDGGAAALPAQKPLLQLTLCPPTPHLEKDKKILEATNKVIHLLTGEVWKFLGYTAVTNDLTVPEHQAASHQGCSPREAAPNECETEPISCPEGSWYHNDLSKPTKDSEGVPERKDVCSEGGVLAGADCTQPQYLLMKLTLGVKEELALQVEQRVSPSDHYSPEDQVQPLVNHTKDEPVVAMETDPTITACTQYLPHIKEEPCGEEHPPATATSKQRDSHPATPAKSPESEERMSTILYPQIDYTVPDTTRHSGQQTPETTLTAEKKHACCKWFRRTSDLQKHQKVTGRSQSIVCPNCGKCFPTNSMYIRHRRIHTGEKPFPCPYCEKSFAIPAQLTSHQRIHTGEKPFACEHCGRRFSHKFTLVNHQRTHTGEKPFTCSQCGKCFSRNAVLIQHQRVHTGEKPYSCSVCSRSFRCHTTLVGHQRVHTGEKPYSCNVCGKRFTNSSDVGRHQWVHTGKKPFSCDLCGKSFTTRSLVARHRQIHTREKK